MTMGEREGECGGDDAECESEWEGVSERQRVRDRE